jgi:hypothetical protein
MLRVPFKKISAIKILKTYYLKQPYGFPWNLALDLFE